MPKRSGCELSGLTMKYEAAGSANQAQVMGEGGCIPKNEVRLRHKPKLSLALRMEPVAEQERAAKKEEDDPSASENDEGAPGAEGPDGAADGASVKLQPAKVDRGMLVMCSTSKEQRAASEALALFNNYADLWEEKESAGAPAKESAHSDLLDDLRKEVAGLRGPKRRFEQRYTKVKGVLLYIYRGPWEKEGPDPVEFVMWMVERMKAAQEYGRFIARVVPLQVCGAAHQLLRNAAPLIAAKFPKSDPCSFEIDFACRNNSAYTRRETQMEIIKLGLGYPHFVSHSMPQKTVLVEITNKIAGISVVPRYYALARFNIQQQQSKAKVQADAAKEKTAAPAHKTSEPASEAATAAIATQTPAPPAAAAAAAMPAVEEKKSADETSKATADPAAAVAAPQQT